MKREGGIGRSETLWHYASCVSVNYQWITSKSDRCWMVPSLSFSSSFFLLYIYQFSDIYEIKPKRSNQVEPIPEEGAGGVALSDHKTKIK